MTTILDFCYTMTKEQKDEYEVCPYCEEVYHKDKLPTKCNKCGYCLRCEG